MNTDTTVKAKLDLANWFRDQEPRTTNKATPATGNTSPLPWEVIDRAERYIGSGDTGPYLAEVKNPADAKLIVRAVNNADKLAEALRAVKAILNQPVFKNSAVIEIMLGDCEIAKGMIDAALAAYEEAKQ